MFQIFDPPAAGAKAVDRIAKLRALMSKLGVDAVLVPREDEFMGEYVPPSAERLKWLTGFSGSAGIAVVAHDKAAVCVDGRYTVQARQQVDLNIFEVVHLPDTLREWLTRSLAEGSVIGFDPWLHTVGEIESLTKVLAKTEIKLKPLSRNPVDAVWGNNRPKPPQGAVIPQPIEFAGRTAADKIAAIQQTLRDDGQHAVILTLPDSIAWAFNIRGSDVAHNPVPLAFAIVPTKGKPEIFIDPAKVGANVKGHITAAARLMPPDQLGRRIDDLKKAGKPVRLDSARSAYWFKARLGTKLTAAGADPCIAPKAIKNAAEIAGTRAAHERDGAAVVRYLAWLETAAADGALDEITAVKKLEDFRRDTGALKEISFDTISGSGPNGAIVHYRVTTASNRVLKPGELFLVDSGAQYTDGTTDITRTLAIGKPTAEMRQRFTLVLKGHVALARARFPAGTTGAQLDTLARHALWQAGLDFDHGTGHGVGSYLSVHEGPQSIGKKSTVPLEAGMILSNEPGYYKEGHYGIRIEALVLVTEAAVPAGGERAMLGFETLTLAPLDRALIEVGMLDDAERTWLETYHARVRKTLEPALDREARAWLAKATAPLGR